MIGSSDVAAIDNVAICPTPNNIRCYPAIKKKRRLAIHWVKHIDTTMFGHRVHIKGYFIWISAAIDNVRPHALQTALNEGGKGEGGRTIDLKNAKRPSKRVKFKRNSHWRRGKGK